MGSVEIVLSKEYGYVVLVLVLYYFLNVWMILQVKDARNKYKVYHPILYASESENKDAKLFNFVQRAHQNSLEYMPLFFILLILGGVRHPYVATGLGLVYVVSRYFYFKGYTSDDIKKRLPIGKYGFFALFGLLFCTISFGFTLLLA